MKPQMFVPPAQAEALSDAQGEQPLGDRLAPLPWLDEDAEDPAPSPAIFPAPRPAARPRLGLRAA